MTVSSFHKTRERNGIPHGQHCIENHRVIESLWANLYLCMAEIHHRVYKNTSHRGQCATLNLCNDKEKNPGPPIHSIDPTQTIKAPYIQGDIKYFGENAGKQCVAMYLGALI